MRLKALIHSFPKRYYDDENYILLGFLPPTLGTARGPGRNTATLLADS